MPSREHCTAAQLHMWIRSGCHPPRWGRWNIRVRCLVLNSRISTKKALKFPKWSKLFTVSLDPSAVLHKIRVFNTSRGCQNAVCAAPANDPAKEWTWVIRRNSATCATYSKHIWTIIYIYAYNILISVNIYCEYINIHLYYSITVYIEFTSMIPEYRQNAGEGLEDEMGRSESKWSAY